MNRGRLVLLALALLLGPAALQAQFYYTLVPGLYDGETNVTITGYYGPDGNVTIPATIDGLPVTTIGENAFLEDIGVTNITIPDSVTSIGPSAFAQTGLISITIPGSVYSIGANAFANSYLTAATIENGVTSIGASAFFNCPYLANVTIPGSVLGIGPYAFFLTPSLTNVTISAGVIGVGDYAFFEAGLTSVAIPDSVTSIGEQAFAGCNDLTDATIGRGVTYIGAGAFYLSGLMEITVDPQNPSYSSVDGVLFDKNQTTLIQYPGGLPGNYTIPGTVNNLATNAFENGSGITGITIPASLINIGDFAFASCSALTNAIMLEGVTSIGNSTFINCSELNSFTIPNSVTGIGPNAFCNCFSVQPLRPPPGSTNNPASITIPASVTSIGANAFCNCFDLTSIYFLGNAPVADSPVFSGPSNMTVYYLPGTTGWTATFAGVQTAVWKMPFPVLLTSSPNFGVRSNMFGFTVSWATNRAVVVQATEDLANPVWKPLQTNTLTGGVFNFSDPQWTNYPGRFYRISSP